MQPTQGGDDGPSKVNQPYTKTVAHTQYSLVAQRLNSRHPSPPKPSGRWKVSSPLTRPNISPCMGPYSTRADPLSAWLRYIQWAEQKFVGGSSLVGELKERCARCFTHDARYKNDERYIKVFQSYPHGVGDRECPHPQVWVSYIAEQTEPEEIFRHMHRCLPDPLSFLVAHFRLFSNHVGTRVALFWVAWAFVAEKKGDFKFVDKLFAKGIQLRVSLRV